MENLLSAKKIRVIDTGKLTAAENMALDEALLELREENLIPDTIRFLSFNPHCVLSGYFQTIENEIRISYCIKNGIDINRRITGGGALYWGTKDIGWEIFARKDSFSKFVFGVEDYYKLFCSSVALGLQKFDLNANFRPRNDIEVNGKKISGSGGTSIKNAFMFQGTLLVDINIDIMLRALKIPIEKLKYKEISSLKERITWLARELGHCPEREKIINNILAGFCENLKIDYYFDELSSIEKERLNKKVNYFRSASHIYKIKSPSSVYTIKSIKKTPTGFIKCNALVNFKRNVLKNIIFTGDFFAYPKRSIFDLESLLKNIPLKEENIIKITKEFFINYPQKIEGISYEIILNSIMECLEKLKLRQYKIPNKYLKDIFIIKDKIIKDKKSSVENTGCMKNIEVFLLPYCAKLPDCSYRSKQGCSFCGKCSIGDAIKLLNLYNIKSITITSYEHLEETLINLKKSGVNFFGGACCEAFYIKHVEDFERIGLPGILINIDNKTCYDLGKYEDAYAGKFEGFTKIKIQLLKKVLSAFNKDKVFNLS